MKKLTTATFNALLANQSTLNNLTIQRPKILIYTDFGGNKPTPDLQTIGELTSAAWKATAQTTLFINDNALALSPLNAAYNLAATFPYSSSKQNQKNTIHTIVIHVIDPGVGNKPETGHTHPRALVLRKDGVLFVGPDNGTLSFVCPKKSIQKIWELNSAAVSTLSGIDLEAGGTFHGRDLFCEAACRIAAGTSTCDQLGIPYSSLTLKNTFPAKDLVPKKSLQSIIFTEFSTERFEAKAPKSHDYTLFETAFFLGIIQSPVQSICACHGKIEVTKSKKLFIIHKNEFDHSPVIALINKVTGNIYLGPDNGLGCTFFKGYIPTNYQLYELTSDLFLQLCKIKNNEDCYQLITTKAILSNHLPVQIDFLGDEKAITYDTQSRPLLLRARIWIDAYGNIKTTAQSTLIATIFIDNPTITITLNDITHQAIIAHSFSEVAAETLFIYKGSSAVSGSNPHRSNRYVEISTNGTFGSFGIDFFTKNGQKPLTGQEVVFSFLYKK